MLRLLALVALLSVHCAQAGIYGTSPVANTVLSAGRIATVTWRDDQNEPSISEMGPVKLDLYVGESLVMTLADDLDPASGSADVWITPSLRHNGSDYHMRFICQDPPLTVYTADFGITDMANMAPLDGLDIGAHNESAPTVTYVTPMLTLVLPDATVVSTLKPTPVTMRPTPTAPPYTVEEDDEPHALPAQTGAAVATLGKRPTLDMERIKFRLVFIFWPALVGISLAL
ncbi:hypothetical protein BN946_scf184912.g47 [Trametes cinnabarina]|uniref:Yeast cell wall synthesis Kre9/Knh1-like N-terminal domain-containing protein n=1 Tax=Pycnoporus cinnabarinus TaxID=5643 RepID=A0A060SYB6_PYCCI|nr:hypothetical protein BN946_scf184912.g47 [Trametes cinnabarina]